MPYVSDVTRARSFLGTSVGDGQCVAFVHAAVATPSTPAWHRGEPVKGNTAIPPGTVIATFDADGRYGNHTNGTSHAAIYLGQTADGIQVLDQWHGPTASTSSPVHQRTIHFRGWGHKVDDGDAFYVVQ